MYWLLSLTFECEHLQQNTNEKINPNQSMRLAASLITHIFPPPQPAYIPPPTLCSVKCSDFFGEEKEKEEHLI
jgi:hypothetical protein